MEQWTLERGKPLTSPLLMQRLHCKQKCGIEKNWTNQPWLFCFRFVRVFAFSSCRDCVALGLSPGRDELFFGHWWCWVALLEDQLIVTFPSKTAEGMLGVKEMGRALTLALFLVTTPLLGTCRGCSTRKGMSLGLCSPTKKAQHCQMRKCVIMKRKTQNACTFMFESCDSEDVAMCCAH